MKQDSPLYGVLIQSIIDNMNLSNREQLIATMQQAAQPNPEAQQMAMAAQQAQLQFQQSQTNALNGQAAESKHGLLRFKLKQNLRLKNLKLTV